MVEDKPTFTVSSSESSNLTQSCQAVKVTQRQAMQCAICGDRAFGYNFGAITCESCKSFYRRHAHKHEEFHCPSDGNCTINLATRKYCPACRMKKCFGVGMRRPTVNDTDDATVREAAEIPSANCRAPLSNVTVSTVAPQNLATNSTETSQITAEESQVCLNPHEMNLSRLPAKIRLKRRHSLDNKLNAESLASSSAASASSATHTDLENAEYAECKRQILSALRYITSIWSVEEIDAAAKAGGANSHLYYSEVSLRRYVLGMQLIADFAALPQAARVFGFRKNLMEQMCLISTLYADAQGNAWMTTAPDGVVHIHPFDEFGAVCSTHGLDSSEFIKKFRRFIQFLREQFPSDYPFISVTLCLLSATQLSRQSQSAAKACVDRLSSHAIASVITVHEKHLKFLQCYLRRHYGATSSAKLASCWQTLELANAVGELASGVVNDILSTIPLPVPEFPASPTASLTASRQQKNCVDWAATAIAPLVVEKMFQSLSVGSNVPDNDKDNSERRNEDS